MFIISIRGERLSDLKNTQAENGGGGAGGTEGCKGRMKTVPSGKQRQQEAGLGHRGSHVGDGVPPPRETARVSLGMMSIVTATIK